jgi:hypothetical protein
MADSVWVDTDRMGVVTPQVVELAQKTLAARTVLLEALGRLSEAPGVNDEAALAFRAAHDPISESAVGAMQDFVGVANGLLAGIRTVVHGYTATEEGNTVPTLSELPADQTPNKVPFGPMTAVRQHVDQTPNPPIETPRHPVLPLQPERLTVAHPIGVPTETPRFLRSVHELPADSPVDDLP